VTDAQSKSKYNCKCCAAE